jgi:hypothetical protein
MVQRSLEILDLPDAALESDLNGKEDLYTPKFGPLSTKERMACRMYAAGLKTAQICSALGMSKGSFNWAQGKEEWKLYSAELQKSLDTEFQNLMFKVTEVVRKSLDSADISTALNGANFWAKYSGRFSQKIEVQHSAEDLVKLILTGESSTGSTVQAKEVPKLVNPPTLQESNRDLISSPEQEGGDCTVPAEQHPGGYRQQLTLPLGYS